MRAIVLLGHGSLRSASGAAMIRCAARLRARGLAPLVAAAFLNYSRPTLMETAARCRARGATEVLIQPYFLIAGAYVRHDLPALVASVAAHYPGLRFTIGDALGDHAALIRLALHRVQDALDRLPRADGPRGLLLMAHGTPLPEANAPLYRVLEAVAREASFARRLVGYLDCNEPTIPAALAALAAEGARQIVALPYFLHMGRHVREDLPALIAQAQATLPAAIVQAHHLDYDPLLVEALAERIVTHLRSPQGLNPSNDTDPALPVMRDIARQGAHEEVAHEEEESE
ncbi:MAG TPA: sirohydrochlorin chelatase [Caldilineaceae bacterium]|nr:sirohydrochlorin chelatase [Caldilineaceae bacterium]